jgi:hypothetical protein
MAAEFSSECAVWPGGGITVLNLVGTALCALVFFFLFVPREAAI